MKKLISILLMLCLACSLSVCFAAEEKLESPTDLDSLLTELDGILQPQPPASVVVEMPSEPVPVVMSESPEVYSIDYSVGGVYPGSIPSAALNVFAGIMAQNFGEKYVCYKSDRYSYVMYYGNDLQCNGTSFSGKGKVVTYSTQGDFPLTFGNGLLSVDNANAIIYTNLNKDLPGLPGMEVVNYAAFIAFMLVVFFGFGVLCLIFFRR